jgi:hypothetical protein
MRTVLSLLFIAVVGGTAAWVAQRPTVVSGSVIAADVYAVVHDKGITEVRCDDDAVVTWSGAAFRCHVAASDGSKAVIRYALDRNGNFDAKVEEDQPTAGPSNDRPRKPRPPGADPWSE